MKMYTCEKCGAQIEYHWDNLCYGCYTKGPLAKHLRSQLTLTVPFANTWSVVASRREVSGYFYARPSTSARWYDKGQNTWKHGTPSAALMGAE